MDHPQLCFTMSVLAPVLKSGPAGGGGMDHSVAHNDCQMF
jgi:hypothetical protein